MIKISKFEKINGKINEQEIETWADNYFYVLMNIFNNFLSRLDVQEALSRLEQIPFDNLVREELEDENEEIISLAVARVSELLEIELDFMRAYVDDD